MVCIILIISLGQVKQTDPLMSESVEVRDDLERNCNSSSQVSTELLVWLGESERAIIINCYQTLLLALLISNIHNINYKALQDY